MKTVYITTKVEDRQGLENLLPEGSTITPLKSSSGSYACHLPYDLSAGQLKQLKEQGYTVVRPHERRALGEALNEDLLE